MEHLPIGTRVEKTMGVKLRGTVTKRLGKRYTDGQYRPPMNYEIPIHVEWDDDTYGWIDRRFLKRLK